MSDIRYEVDGNIVKARFTKPWANKFFVELLKLDINIPTKLIDYLFCMKYNEWGIAKCHPDDKFDVELGKLLARKRLVTKYNRMRYLFFKKLDRQIASYHSITSAKCVKYFLASEVDYHVWVNNPVVDYHRCGYSHHDLY